MKKSITGKKYNEVLKLLGCILIIQMVPIFFYILLYDTKTYFELSFNEIIGLHLKSFLAMAIVACAYIIIGVVFFSIKDLVQRFVKKRK
ncbi:hypothetical protein [Flavobacterium beibuense]|uniref:hypothetical protein n=1 Tax=Flavobacterium beibuense TaxID=657326 RepID=UPI003A940427